MALRSRRELPLDSGPSAMALPPPLDSGGEGKQRGCGAAGNKGHALISTTPPQKNCGRQMTQKKRQKKQKKRPSPLPPSHIY